MSSKKSISDPWGLHWLWVTYSKMFNSSDSFSASRQHVSVGACSKTREKNLFFLVVWIWWGSEAKISRKKPDTTLCPLLSLIFFDNSLFSISFYSNSLALLLTFDLEFQLAFLTEGSCVLEENWWSNPAGSWVEYICQWWDTVAKNWKKKKQTKTQEDAACGEERMSLGLPDTIWLSRYHTGNCIGRRAWPMWRWRQRVLSAAWCVLFDSMISILNAFHGTWTHRSTHSSFLPFILSSSLIAVTCLTSEGIWDSARYDHRHWECPPVDRTGKVLPSWSFCSRRGDWNRKNSSPG